MRILVVALNPSIDAEWHVDEVRWEEKNSIRAERRWAGGKGVNVARWLKYLGAEPKLVLPLGGAAGRELADGLRAEHLPARIVPIQPATRVNVVVTAKSGRQLRFNPPGPHLSRQEWLAILNAVDQELKHASLLILSGSLPRGLATAAYAQLIRRAKRAGIRTLLDCDGPALSQGARAQPFLIKPNQHELEQWCGRRLASEAAVLRAAKELSTVSRGWVLVSRGAKPALLVNVEADGHFRARPPRLMVQNTVGAGDALLAALAQAVGNEAPPHSWLRAAISAGSAATQCEAGKLP